MKIVLDIKDDKVPFVLELLKHFKFVKIESISEKKEEIKEAVKELNLIRFGKMKGIPARELLNEL